MSINRRKFFGIVTASTLIAALEPAIIMSAKKTYFLPPVHGWFPHRVGIGTMREVRQYMINEDLMPVRYDALGLMGESEVQFHIELPESNPVLARSIISETFWKDGIVAISKDQAKFHKLNLPRCSEKARYV